MHRPEPNFNVAAQVIKQAEQNPGNTAIIFEGKTTSYGEFATRVRKQAGLLRSRGVCVGDRVGFLGFNQPGFIETMFATISLGAVFVPLNFRLTGEELAFIIGDAGVHTLVVDPELTGVIDSVRDRLPCHHYFALEGTLPGYDCLEQAMQEADACLLYTSPSPRDRIRSRMPSSA